MEAITDCLKRLDRVQLGCGQIVIVTGYHPNRPSNCYSGVLEKGKGKEYVFGARHNPRKIGVVDESHPALVNNKIRKESKAVTNGMDAATVSLLKLLVKAIKEDNFTLAKALTESLEQFLPE